MKKLNKLKALGCTSVGTLVALFTPSAFAACTSGTSGGLSQIFCNITSEFNSIGDMVVNFFYLAGLILFAVGILLVNKDQKQPGQDHAKKGGISMIVGVCLIILTFLINTFATSIKGDSVDDNDWKIGSGDI